MPRFRLPHFRGNVRGLKNEEEDKVSLFYSETNIAIRGTLHKPITSPAILMRYVILQNKF